MAYQLIYTSIRSGLTAGRSGFCTAARHQEIKESLVARLEDLASAYDRGILGREGALPLLYSYRIIDIRESRYHVLMRIGDAGNDYSGRTNHLAHFLVIEPGELAGLSITPAEAILALQARGFWKSRYEDSAAYLGERDIVPLSSLTPSVALPAAGWAEWTGNPGNAAHLYDSDGPQKTGFPTEGDSEDSAGQLLRLFAEGALLSNPERIDSTSLWSVPFTTLLQSTADRKAYAWAGVPDGTSLAEKEEATGRRLFAKGITVTPPAGDLATVAAGREVEAVYSPVPLTPSQRAVTEVKSPAPAQAGTVSGPEQMNLPSADLSESVIGPAIPLSLNPGKAEKQRQGNGLVKVALIAAAVVCLLGLIGATFYYFSPGKRLEIEVDELVEKEDWNGLNEKLEESGNSTLLQNSVYLKEQKQLATAILDLKQIQKFPYEGYPPEEGEHRPSETVNEIFARLPESVKGAAQPHVNEARISANIWEDAYLTMVAAREALREATKAEPPLFSFEEKPFDGQRDALEDLYKDHGDAKDPILIEMKSFETVQEQFKKFKAYLDSPIESPASQESVELKSLENLIDNKPFDKETRKSLVAIAGKFKTVFIERNPQPTSKPKVTVTKTETREKKPEGEKDTPETVEDWPVYLIPIEEGNRLNLSLISEIGEPLPKEFRMKTVGGEMIDLKNTTGAAYYFGSNKVLTPKGGMSLEIENDRLNLFVDRARLFPDSDPPAYEIIIMSGETGAGSTPLLGDLRVNDCLTQNNTSFQIAEPAKTQLERFQVTHAEGNWRMTLHLGNSPYSASGAIAGLSVDPISKIKAKLETAQSDKSNAEQSIEIESEFNNTFMPLGKLLFPEFTGTHPRFEIVEDGDDHRIAPLKDPKRITEAWQRFDKKEPYHEFVENLFGKLKNLAGDCQAHIAANSEIEEIKRNVRANHEQAVTEWQRLAKLSERGKWSTPPHEPASFKTEREAEKELKEYEAHLHFSHFLEAWEKIFLDDEKMKSLSAVLNDPAVLRYARPPDEIEKGIKNLEATLSQLESDDVLKELQVSFHYTWKEKLTGGSSTGKSFLVLQSKPDHAN